MRVFLTAMASLCLSSVAMADVYKVKRGDSVLAVITHKAGVAARLAHNHLVFAPSYVAKIDVNPAALEKSKFEVKIDATQLEIDDPAMQAKWYPQVQALSLLSEPFSPVSESDKAKVMASMKSEEQLNTAVYKEITAKIISMEASPSQVGAEAFTHKAKVQVTVRGKMVEKEAPVAIALTNASLNAVALIRCKFTEFGIEPFSAFLGAVANKDEFEIFVLLRAEK